VTLDAVARRAAPAICLLLTLAVSSIVFVRFIANFNGQFAALLSDLAYYRAARPYVARTLLPTTVRALSSVVPADLRARAARSVEASPRAQQIFSINKQHLSHTGRPRLEADYPVEDSIAVVVMFGCLIAFAYAMRALFDALYASPPLYRNLIPALAVIGLPPWFAYVSYAYDFCTLLCSTLCLVFLARGRRRAFLIAFTAACFNKETSVLIIFLFVTYELLSGQMERRRWITLAAAQVAIYCAVRGLLAILFRHNPGVMGENHFWDHNVPLIRDWLRYGWGLTDLTARALVVFCIVYRWNEKPLLLRCGLIMAPPLLIACLFFGYLDEYRAYLECYPIFVLLVLDTVGRLFGAHPRHAAIASREVAWQSQ
jgi:hypothetical protein